jgi:hypothetical protein
MNIDVVDIITILIALSAAVIAWKKAPLEGHALDAEAAGKYQRIAIDAADRLERLEKQVGELEKSLNLANARALKFEDWAKRLSGQVTSMGGVPVPFERGAAHD